MTQQGNSIVYKPYQQDLSEAMVKMIVPAWETVEADRGMRFKWLRDPKNAQVAAWQLVLQKVRDWEDYNPYGMREPLTPTWTVLEWKDEKHMYESLVSRPEEDKRRAATSLKQLENTVLELQQQQQTMSVAIQLSEITQKLQKEVEAVQDQAVQSEHTEIIPVGKYFDRESQGDTDLPDGAYWIKPSPIFHTSTKLGVTHLKRDQRYKIRGKYVVLGVYQMENKALKKHKCLSHKAIGEFDNMTMPEFTMLPKIPCTGLACGSHAKAIKKMFFFLSGSEGQVLVPFIFIMNARIVEREESKFDLQERDFLIKVTLGKFFQVDCNKIEPILVSLNPMLSAKHSAMLPQGWKSAPERQISLANGFFYPEGKMVTLDFVRPFIRGPYSMVCDASEGPLSLGYRLASFMGIPFMPFESLDSTGMRISGKVLFVFWDTLHYFRNLVGVNRIIKQYSHATILLRVWKTFHPPIPGFNHYMFWDGISRGRLKTVYSYSVKEITDTIGGKLWRSEDEDPYKLVMSTELDPVDSDTEEEPH